MIATHILNDPKFIQYLRDWEREQLQIDSCTDEQSSIANNAKERFGVKPAEFKKLAKAFYDESFAQKRFEEAEELLHAAEIVRGKK